MECLNLEAIAYLIHGQSGDQTGDLEQPKTVNHVIQTDSKCTWGKGVHFEYTRMEWRQDVVHRISWRCRGIGPQILQTDPHDTDHLSLSLEVFDHLGKSCLLHFPLPLLNSSLGGNKNREPGDSSNTI